MDPSRSERIQELFAAAIEHPAGEREAYVIDSVADLELRAELLSLVKAHEGRGSLDSIAEHLASSASTEKHCAAGSTVTVNCRPMKLSRSRAKSPMRSHTPTVAASFTGTSNRRISSSRQDTR